MKTSKPSGLEFRKKKFRTRHRFGKHMMRLVIEL